MFWIVITWLPLIVESQSRLALRGNVIPFACSYTDRGYGEMKDLMNLSLTCQQYSEIFNESRKEMKLLADKEALLKHRPITYFVKIPKLPHINEDQWQLVFDNEAGLSFLHKFEAFLSTNLNNDSDRAGKLADEIVGVNPQVFAAFCEGITSFAESYPEGDAEITLSKELALQLIVDKKEHMWYKYLPQELREDREIVFAVVSQYGHALRDVENVPFRSDFAIVLSAVSSSPNALRYASKELRDNEIVVRKALEKDGRALRFASKRLQNDPALMKMFRKGWRKYLAYLAE